MDLNNGERLRFPNKFLNLSVNSFIFSNGYGKSNLDEWTFQGVKTPKKTEKRHLKVRGFLTILLSMLTIYYQNPKNHFFRK